MAQTVWYVPTALDQWNQLIGNAPGHYGRRTWKGGKTPPFPMEDAIQADIENLTSTIPEFRGKKVADFIDKSILSDLEREGFFAQLASRYGK